MIPRVATVVALFALVVSATRSNVDKEEHVSMVGGITSPLQGNHTKINRGSNASVGLRARVPTQNVRVAPIEAASTKKSRRMAEELDPADWIPNALDGGGE